MRWGETDSAPHEKPEGRMDSHTCFFYEISTLIKGESAKQKEQVSLEARGSRHQPDRYRESWERQTPLLVRSG